MYIKISSIIFVYILPINFCRLSDCQKADTPFPKVEETSSFQIFSNNATVSTWLSLSKLIFKSSSIIGSLKAIGFSYCPFFIFVDFNFIYQRLNDAMLSWLLVRENSFSKFIKILYILSLEILLVSGLCFHPFASSKDFSIFVNLRLICPILYPCGTLIWKASGVLALNPRIYKAVWKENTTCSLLSNIAAKSSLRHLFSYRFHFLPTPVRLLG